MSYIYVSEDYHGRVDTEYRRYPFLVDRAKLYGSKFNTIKDRLIIVAGCGFGYTVDELASLGFTNVWGFDASRYAVEEASVRELSTEQASRITLADATKKADMDNIVATLGRPYLVLDEDLLSCADTIEEAKLMLANLRSILHNRGQLVHVLTMRAGTVPHISEGTEQITDFLWLSPEEWREIVGPDEAIYVAGSMAEVD